MPCLILYPKRGAFVVAEIELGLQREGYPRSLDFVWMKKVRFREALSAIFRYPSASFWIASGEKDILTLQTAVKSLLYGAIILQVDPASRV
jgi:hypothetical protein